MVSTNSVAIPESNDHINLITDPNTKGTRKMKSSIMSENGILHHVPNPKVPLLCVAANTHEQRNHSTGATNHENHWHLSSLGPPYAPTKCKWN